MDKQLEIAELKRLHALITQRSNLSTQIRDARQEKIDCVERYEKIISERKLEIINMLETNFPTFSQSAVAPQIYSHKGKILPANLSSYNKKVMVALIVSALFTFLFLGTLFRSLTGQPESSNLKDLLLIAGGPAIGGLCVCANQIIKKPKQTAYMKQYAEYQEAEKELDELQSSYTIEAEKIIKDYSQSIENFEKTYISAVLSHMRKLSQHQKAIDDFPRFKEEATSECEQEQRNCDLRISEANARLSVCNREIEQIDVLHSAYEDHLSTIITLLETGRANTCKEALNIAIDEEQLRRHRRKMEEIAQEQAYAEAMRAEEVRRYNRAMERQVEEQQRHNRAMEQQQAAYNRSMERATKTQVEEQRRAVMQAKQNQERAAKEACAREMDAHNKALHRCSKCSKRFACSLQGNPNCGAFEPDAIFKH